MYAMFLVSNRRVRACWDLQILSFTLLWLGTLSIILL